MRTALILGNGKYANRLLNLRIEGKVNLAISIFPEGVSSLSRGVDSYIHAGHVSLMLDVLRQNRIERVAFGGDVRLLDLLFSFPTSVLSDPRVLWDRRFYESVAPNMFFPSRYLDVMRLELEKKNIRTILASEIDADLLPGVGYITNHSSPPYSQQDLRSIILDAREKLKDQPRLKIKQSLVYEGGKLMKQESGSTDALLKTLANTRLSAIPRILVKLPPPGVQYTLDAPVIGLKTIELCVQAHVACIIVDAAQGILTDRIDCLAKAADAGIVIYGA